MNRGSTNPNHRRTHMYRFALTFTIVGVLAIGCGQQGSQMPKGDKTDAKSKAAGKTDEHSHGAGPKGGAICHWGGSEYHLEFLPDHDTKVVKVWVYGNDAKTPAAVKLKDGQVSATITGVKSKDSFEMVLKAEPQPGESDGKASLYTG